jgi:hypothetical protein
LSIVFALEQTNQLSLLPDKDLVDLCPPIEPYQVTKNQEKLRPLTTRERSYIQTFPKDFIFTGTKSNLEQMIGNAVPINLARYVGQCILNYELKKENKTTYRQLQLSKWL